MSRYIHVMTRDELVAEIRDLMLWGVAAPHEVPDPTILPPSRLRATADAVARPRPDLGQTAPDRLGTPRNRSGLIEQAYA